MSFDNDRLKGVGRFRSAEGRERFEAADDLALSSWPLTSSAVEVRTSFGTTRINACGVTTGSPVVLLAGALMTSVSWLPNAAALGAAHCVFAVDAFGDAGRSMHDRPVRTRAELRPCGVPHVLLAASGYASLRQLRRGLARAPTSEPPTR